MTIFRHLPDLWMGFMLTGPRLGFKLLMLAGKRKMLKSQRPLPPYARIFNSTVSILLYQQTPRCVWTRPDQIWDRGHSGGQKGNACKYAVIFPNHCRRVRGWGLWRKIREALGVPVVAIGMLEDPALAQSVVCREEEDLVAIARGMLRDPYWTIHAAKSLRSEYTPIPKQYERAYC